MFSFYICFKRILDFSLSFIAIEILSPLFFLIAILIRMDTNGSAFYTHERVGYKDKDITILKFRTMVNGADKLIKEFNEEQMKEWKSSYKLEDDPRLTKVGRILRKTSLDELPQLLDILTGKMSFVGPRPIIREELNDKWTKREQELLLSVKPGLTGYWACNGRSCTTYSKRKQLELYYVEHQSLWLDLKILLLTVPNVLKGIGAK